MTIGQDGRAEQPTTAGADGQGPSRTERLEQVARAARRLRHAETQALTQLQVLGDVAGDPDGDVAARILAPVNQARQGLDRALDALELTGRAH